MPKWQRTECGPPVSVVTLPIYLIKKGRYTGETLIPDNLERHYGTMSELQLPSDLLSKESAKERNKMFDLDVFERHPAHEAEGCRVRKRSGEVRCRFAAM